MTTKPPAEPGPGHNLPPAPQPARTLAGVQQAVEALTGTLTLIREAQDVLTGYLVPDGYGADEAVAKLLGLLDGPHQREIEGAASAALRALGGELAEARAHG